MILGQHADPHVDVVDRFVSRRQFVLDRDVVADVGERFDAFQAHRFAGGVVIGQPVVASALDVQGRQIEAARTGRAEQEVPHVVDQVRVDLLLGRRRQPLEDRVDAAVNDRRRIEERVTQRDRTGFGDAAIVVQAGEFAGQRRVAVPERRRGEQVADRRIDRRIVTLVAFDGVAADQLRQVFVERDGLDLGDDSPPGALEHRFVVQRRVGGGDFVGDAVVLADPQRVHRDQTVLFVDAVVAGEEEPAIVPRQQVAVGRRQPSADERPQRVRRFGVAAVHHRPVEERGDLVDLLGGRVDAGAVGHAAAGEPDRGDAGGEGVEVFVTGGDGDQRFDVAFGRRGDVVVDELTPLPNQVGQSAGAFDRFLLIEDEVADLAGRQPVLAGQRRNAVGVIRSGHADERRVGGTEVVVGGVVAGAVERLDVVGFTSAVRRRIDI